MFSDFEKATKEQNMDANSKSSGPQPGMPKEEDMKQFENQFMGMFGNLAKEIEQLAQEDGNLGADEDDESDREPTEDEMKEVQKMMQGLMGAFGGAGGSDFKMPDFG